MLTPTTLPSHFSPIKNQFLSSLLRLIFSDHRPQSNRHNLLLSTKLKFSPLYNFPPLDLLNDTIKTKAKMV